MADVQPNDKDKNADKGKDHVAGAKEQNKPLQQDVIGDPKKTGSKAGAMPKGATRVDIKKISTGFVHVGIPSDTAGSWIKSNPGKFEIVTPTAETEQ